MNARHMLRDRLMHSYGGARRDVCDLEKYYLEKADNARARCEVSKLPKQPKKRYTEAERKNLKSYKKRHPNAANHKLTEWQKFLKKFYVYYNDGRIASLPFGDRIKVASEYYKARNSMNDEDKVLRDIYDDIINYTAKGSGYRKSKRGSGFSGGILRDNLYAGNRRMSRNNRSSGGMLIDNFYDF